MCDPKSLHDHFWSAKLWLPAALNAIPLRPNWPIASRIGKQDIYRKDDEQEVALVVVRSQSCKKICLPALSKLWHFTSWKASAARLCRSNGLSQLLLPTCATERKAAWPKIAAPARTHVRLHASAYAAVSWAMCTIIMAATAAWEKTRNPKLPRAVCVTRNASNLLWDREIKWRWLK